MSDRAILLSSRSFDQGTIIDHGEEDTGFPVENLQDSNPKTPWRFTSLLTPPDFTSYFVVDLAPGPGSTVQPYDTFATLFANVQVTGADTWRVRTGQTPSGIGNYDSGVLPLWQGASSGPNDPRSPRFYQPEGVHAFHHLDTTRTETFVRVDYSFNDTPSGSGGQIGRFMLGKALTPFVLHNSGTPTPVGSPPKLVNTWEVVLTQEDRELLVYPLAFDRGSSPRVLRSWGGEVFPLDGAGTVLMHNDILAPDSWTLHQLAVYGYLDPIAPITTRGRRAKGRTSITVRGM